LPLWLLLPALLEPAPLEPAPPTPVLPETVALPLVAPVPPAPLLSSVGLPASSPQATAAASQSGKLTTTARRPRP
jgi:hypothetical protein